MRACLLVAALFYSGVCAFSQWPVTVPWSSTLNVTFGNGTTNPGPPLSTGYTDFTYTTNSTPAAGSYSVIYSNNDAGHVYAGAFPMIGYKSGYKMIACYDVPFAPKTLFRDTIRNICGNTKYLFWAGINNLQPTYCLKPNFTMSVETLTGTVIASFQTGNIGSGNNYAWYFGYYDPIFSPPVPFYGGIFLLPAGITDVVVKITTNPSTAYYECKTIFEVDNIILMPVGPNIHIASTRTPDAWITASCFQGNVPLVLNGEIKDGYLDFGTPNYILQSYTNPAYQWQLSLDDGYTWTDVPGETNINISHVFNIPDTFWMRMRVSESGDIGNQNCSNVSNVIKVQVDGLPTNFSMSANSPVCTDGDLKFTFTGGVTYNTYGPNGFADNSASPHIYHPALADSGWYYSEMSTFGGCKFVDSEFVRVIGPNLQLSPDREICYGDTVHLSASGATDYLWTPAEGLSSTTISNPIASPIKTTRYEVAVIDGSGCGAVGDVTITLRDSILKAMMTGPDFACGDELIFFRDTSVGAITNWHWDFGNGNTSDQQQPPAQHYPVSSGTFYSVNLTITDTAGCVQTVKKTIKSMSNCLIAVPSAFSPNQDGLNDYLYPLNGFRGSNLLFRVYNRWGALLFESKDWTKKWDGTLRGTLQPPGVYVWTLEYTDIDQKKVFLRGTAALIR